MTPHGATGVVVTADGGFRTGRTTSPPDSRVWTPSTPTATGWFKTKTCRLMTERTSSGTCTTSTSAGQRSVAVLLPSPGLCLLPWDKGHAVAVLLPLPGPVFCALPWDKGRCFVPCLETKVGVLSPALGQRSVFCPLPWGRGRRFVPCLGAKVSVLFIAMGQRSVYCSLLWGKGLCIVHCFGAKVSESQCFAPCLGTKVNQCFVFCLGTKVSKFVLFLPWYKDQLGLWVLAR